MVMVILVMLTMRLFRFCTHSAQCDDKRRYYDWTLCYPQKTGPVKDRPIMFFSTEQERAMALKFLNQLSDKLGHQVRIRVASTLA